MTSAPLSKLPPGAVRLTQWLAALAAVSLPAAYVSWAWGWEMSLKHVRKGTSGPSVLLLVLGVLASFLAGFWLARGPGRRRARPVPLDAANAVAQDTNGDHS